MEKIPRHSGNQNATKHGGAAAVYAIQNNQPFKGLASEVEKQLIADFENEGSTSLLTKDCMRVHTAAELYWQAILGAAEAGDMPKFESYVRVYGWLATAGARLLGQLAALQGKDAPIDAAAVLKSIKGGLDDQTGD